jgi:LysM repeat protein
MPDSQRIGMRTSQLSATTTLALLATKAGISEKQLAWYNPRLRIAKRGKLAAGQTVFIPTRATVSFARGVPDPSIEHYGSGTSGSGRAVHVVRRGESLSGIARKYGLTLARLKSLNGLSSNRAVPGQSLRVRSGASVASRKSSRSEARPGDGKRGAKAAPATKGSGKTGSGKSSKAKGKRKATSKSSGKSGGKSGGKSTSKKSSSRASKTKKDAH